MATIKATQLKNRDKVKELNEGDMVIHGSFKVEVLETVCAMGGDICIKGIVKSFVADHPYEVFYGEQIFWGPKRLVKGGLDDYLYNRKPIKKKS